MQHDFFASDQGRSPRATRVVSRRQPLRLFLGRRDTTRVAQTNNGLGDAMGSKLQPRRNIAEKVSGCLVLPLTTAIGGFDPPSSAQKAIEKPALLHRRQPVHAGAPTQRDHVTARAVSQSVLLIMPA